MRLCRMENLADKLSLGAERTRAFLFMTAANLIRDLHRRETSRHRNAHEPFDDDVVVDGGHVPVQLPFPRGKIVINVQPEPQADPQSEEV